MEIDTGTRELLKIALLPPGVLVLLLLVGWLFARRFFGRVLILLATVSLYGLSTPVLVDWLGSHLETYPPQTAVDLKRSGADAILVFLANVDRDAPEYGGADVLAPLSLERMDYAVHVHRQTGLPLVLSGGNLHDDTAPVAGIAATWLQQRHAIKPSAIDTASRDTWENARYSADLLRAKQLSRVLLVTHASHMPRAVLSARAAGIDAVAAPFGFEHNPDGVGPTFRDWLPRPGYLARSYRMIHEMLGLVWYSLARR